MPVPADCVPGESGGIGGADEAGAPGVCELGAEVSGAETVEGPCPAGADTGGNDGIGGRDSAPPPCAGTVKVLAHSGHFIIWPAY